MSQGAHDLGKSYCKSSMQDMERFCVACGYLEPDFLQLLMAGLYGLGISCTGFSLP